MNAVMASLRSERAAHPTLAAVVSKVNPQRSIELRLLNSRGWNPVGTVTIPTNLCMPQVGWVVEVRYRHALPESKVLCQPVYLRPRKDIELHECGMSQLRFAHLQG